MRRWLGLAVLAALIAVGTAQAQATLEVEIDKKAALVAPTQVRVSGTSTCPAGATVLEAFLYVVQEGNQSDFTGLPVVCDGTPHRFSIAVNAIDFLFHKGKAQVSAFLLLESGESVSPVRIVHLK